jgi:hypothetical protein
VRNPQLAESVDLNDLSDSKLPCFAAFGEQTAVQLRDRFQPALTHSLVGEYIDRLIDTSLGSNWTRLYDSVSRETKAIVHSKLISSCSINITHSPFCSLSQFPPGVYGS